MEQKASIGRIVHYRTLAGDEPLAAVITHVWQNEMVNLCVFGSNGSTQGQTSVNHEGRAQGAFWS